MREGVASWDKKRRAETRGFEPVFRKKGDSPSEIGRKRSRRKSPRWKRGGGTKKIVNQWRLKK